MAYKRKYKKRPLKAGETRIKRGKKVAVKIIAGKGGRKDKALTRTIKFRYKDSKGNWRMRTITTFTRTMKLGKQKPKI
jgi:hypothetical protein